MSGSLGSIARIGLQLAVTAYFGPVAGAAVGIGMGLLFPEKLPGVEGPRLGPDQGMTSAQIGAAIPILFGTIDINGNVIQDLGRVEHEETEEQGGKGGPTQEVTTYTYSRTYAVLLCDCQDNRPIDGILRIWRNAKLVYDVRSRQEGESDQDYTVRQAASAGFAEKFALYLGTDSQLPDPVLEAAVGVGLQPAYRHRAYIVFYDEDVTDNGGRTSQWKFEVVCNGTFQPDESIEYSPGILYPWLSAVDPRNPLNRHQYRNYLDPNEPWYESEVDGQNAVIAEGQTVAAGGVLDSGQYTNVIGWSFNSFPDGSDVRVMFPAGVPADVTGRAWVGLHYNKVLPTLDGDPYRLYLDDAGSAVLVCPNLYNGGFGIGEGRAWWSGLKLGGVIDSNSFQFGMFEALTDVGGMGSGEYFINNCHTIYIDTSIAAYYPDGRLDAVRFPGPPSNPCDGRPALPENPEFCVLPDGSITQDDPWVYTAGTFKYLRSYVISDGTEGLGYANGDIISTPLGPVLPSGHANDTPAFWAAARAAAVSDGETIPPTFDAQGDGVPYLTYPVVVDHAYTRQAAATVGDPDPVSLGSIVNTICRRCKPLTSDDIDVSMLDETVQGYRIDRIMSGRAGIDTLRQYGYFDCVDGAILSFPTRGRESVATLDDDTLGTSDGDGFVPAVTPTFAEAPELPRFVGVRYPMPHADYVVGMQQTQRGNVDTTNKSYIDVPISMSDDKAKQITEVLMGETWVGRETYKLSISPRLMALEAADAIEVPVAGELQRMVISSLEGGYPGPLATEARRDDRYVYLSTAAGVASGIRPQDLGIAGLTVYALIDSTALTSEQDEPGFYVTAYGTGDRWRGASLYESMDAGANYSRVLSISTASTMGTIDAALPVGPHHIWDEFNTLTVTLAAGTLESRTEAAVLNGANAAFIGGPDRWELIQFRTATLIGEGQYTLSGLLRGRRGTEWAIGLSQYGDTFALASTLARVPKSNSAIGLPRLYKMVTSRTLLEASTAEAFTPEGVALETYAPAHVTASRDGSNNITGTIVRRSRLGPEWLDYADVPLNEESEHYQLDIFAGSAFLRTIDVVGTNVWGYTAAEQTADGLTPGDDVTLLAYQLSAVVGRGYPYEATV